MTEIEGAIVVPEDEGTGLPEDEADWVSAGHVAALAGQSNVSNYVETGMSFQNVSDGTFDITDGLAFVFYEGGVNVQDDDGAYVNNWDQPITFAIRADTTTNIAYNQGEENHVFIDLELTVNNGAEYVVNTTGTSPAEPSLKIGVIDDR